MLAAGSFLDPLYQIVGLAARGPLLPHCTASGLAIIVLTLIVMFVQFPLIAKQTRSMILMQRVQPEIKKIQQKYKDDRAKQNEELLKYYQENKINPLAGLPAAAVDPARSASRCSAPSAARASSTTFPGPGTFSKLYVDICGKTIDHPEGLRRPRSRTHAPSALHFLGMHLNLSAANAVPNGIGTALPYFVLLALVIFTGWYQVRQTQARQLQVGRRAAERADAGRHQDHADLLRGHLATASAPPRRSTSSSRTCGASASSTSCSTRCTRRSTAGRGEAGIDGPPSSRPTRSAPPDAGGSANGSNGPFAERGAPQEEEAKALTDGLDRGHRAHGRRRQGARARPARRRRGRARVRGRRRAAQGPVRHRPRRCPDPGPGEADLAGEAVRPQAPPPPERAHAAAAARVARRRQRGGRRAGGGRSASRSGVRRDDTAPNGDAAERTTDARRVRESRRSERRRRAAGPRRRPPPARRPRSGEAAAAEPQLASERRERRSRTRTSRRGGSGGRCGNSPGSRSGGARGEVHRRARPDDGLLGLRSAPRSTTTT